MIDNESLRRHSADGLQTHVVERHSLAGNMEEWSEAYADIAHETVLLRGRRGGSKPTGVMRA